MPSIPDEFVPLQVRVPVSRPQEEDPGTLDILGSAGVVANWPYRLWRNWANHSDLDTQPDYNPFPELRGSKYESDPERFAYSRSPAETQAIMREWDQDETARGVLARSGWSGTVASLGMGMLDPTLFLPIAKVFSGAAAGASALRIGADAALAGAAGATIGEAAMYATTPDYTMGDVALNVGTATLLSGLIGAGAGALLSKGERAALTEKLHADRETWGATLAPEAASPAIDLAGELPTGKSPSLPSPQAAGAAAADTRELTMRAAPGPLSKLPDPTAKVSPIRRVMTSDFTEARRALADLAETPYIYNENLEGIATTQGPALDRLVKLETGKARVAISQTLDRLYTLYRHGAADVGRMKKIATGIDDLRGRTPEGTMNFPQFKDAIDEALRNGDTHAVPEVAEAARFFREKILSPWRDRAWKELSAEGVDAKTADSYMMRVYNKERIIAQRPDVVNRFTAWLEGDQAKKAAIQERLVDLSAQLDEAEASVASMLKKAKGGSEEHTAAVARVDALYARIEAELTQWQGKSTGEAMSAIRARDKELPGDATARGSVTPDNGGPALDEPLILQPPEDFPVAGEGVTKRQWMNGVRAWAAAKFGDKTVKNASDGSDIIISRSGIKHTLSRDVQSRGSVAAMANLDTMLEKAQFIRTDTDRLGRKEIKGVHTYEARVRIDGQDAAMRIIVREDMNGRRYYDHSEIREKVGDAATGNQPARSGQFDQMLPASPERILTEGGAKARPRRTSADGAVSKAMRRILESDRALSRQELEARANEIVDRILGSPDGRLPYADAAGYAGGAPASDARGPLSAREFMIPDAQIRDFLETDVHQVLEIYLNTMVPDVLLTERFGDVNMTEAFRKIQDEAAAKASAATSEAERTRIHKQRDAVIADLAAIRDRIRHTYGVSSDPRQRFMGRMAATAARFDMITNLGGAVLSSLSDLAGAQWRYGFSATFRHAWSPMLKAMTDPETRTALKQYRSQLKSLGIAAETYLSTRTSGMYDVIDSYKPATRFERGMALAADKFGLASGLTQWTDFTKFAAGMISGGEISRAVEAVASGKAKARQIRDLAEGGIDAVMADRIWKELSAEGGADVVGGIRIPNTGAWTDKGARDAFEGMLARDVDIMVLTPGAEKPLMMSRPVAALILQYKTFVTAANERLLVRSLQARDHQALQGLASAIVLGMMAEFAYSFVADRTPPDSTADWVKAGINRSGILGWYAEGNAVLAKWTGGATDGYRLIGATQPDARYISRTPLAALLGPVAGKFETTVKSFSKLAAKALGSDQEWNANDTYQLRRLLPAQNLFYIRRLLDMPEDAINEDILGVEPKQRGEFGKWVDKRT